MTHWIKVEDQLPDAPYENNNQSEDVLIFDGENIAIGFYESEYNIENDPHAYEGQHVVFSSATWHYYGSFFKTNHNGFPIVTHWAKLPKKP